MSPSEQPNPKAEPPGRQLKKSLLISAGIMFIYGTVFLVLSSGHFTPKQVWFGVQLLNALGFFIAVAAFVRSGQRK